MGIDSHIARAQFTSGHMQEPVVQQQPANTGCMAVGAHKAKHQRAKMIELGQFIATESDQFLAIDNDE